MKIREPNKLTKHVLKWNYTSDDVKPQVSNFPLSQVVVMDLRGMSNNSEEIKQRGKGALGLSRKHLLDLLFYIIQKFQHQRENMPANLRILRNDGMRSSRVHDMPSCSLSTWRAARDPNKEVRFSSNKWISLWSCENIVLGSCWKIGIKITTGYEDLIYYTSNVSSAAISSKRSMSFVILEKTDSRTVHMLLL